MACLFPEKLCAGLKQDALNAFNAVLNKPGHCDGPMRMREVEAARIIYEKTMKMIDAKSRISVSVPSYGVWSSSPPPRGVRGS